MNPPPPSLKSRALRLLAAREYSRAELESKLRAFDDPPGELARALDELLAKGFIDEQRVIESVVNRRASRLGASRIRHELQGKGLDVQSVQRAVAQLQETELERARVVWRKKFHEPAADAASRARQMRFLASRGFGAETIRRVVAGMGDEAG
jgi:regulatory protein